jgi:general stress protein 26
MPVTMSDTAKREQLAKLIAHFDTAMLVTKMSDGRLRSRPLAVAAHEGTAELLFSTAIDSPKVGELEHDPHVNVVMQEKRRFVSITGRARISRDRALIQRLWSESWKVWFPGGKDDRSLALVVVEPEEASFWDASGIEGVKFVFEAAKAYLTHQRPPSDSDDKRTAHLKL